MSSYEMMGFTWQAKSPKQQDAILIQNHVFQDDLGITDLYQFEVHNKWCAAVADVVSSSPYAERASNTVLHSVRNQWLEHSDTDIDFKEIQHHLCQELADSQKTHSSSSTLALVTSTSVMGRVRIQHLGDSRVYCFNARENLWHCLTTDHTYLEELRQKRELEEKQEYASIYSALTGYFCADWLHEVSLCRAHEYHLSDCDALLICTDGVHDILGCEQWSPFDESKTHKEWLIGMKKQLAMNAAYDNVSMVLLRLSKG